MENQEIWKDIEGYEGLYQVSNHGRMKSLKRKGCIKDRILKLKIDNQDYPSVNLFNGCMKTVNIHRLVAIHFIPNPENKPCVNHKKGIKIDNRATELEWCTIAENNKHAYDIGLKIVRRGKNNPLSKSTSQYSLLGKLIKTFGGIREAERITGIGRGHIWYVCAGKRKTAGGYIWKFN